MKGRLLPILSGACAHMTLRFTKPDPNLAALTKDGNSYKNTTK